MPEADPVTITFRPAGPVICHELYIAHDEITDITGLDDLIERIRPERRAEVAERVQQRYGYTTVQATLWRPSVDDTIAAIDRATGCQQCGARLDWSPSNDFCSQFCQEAWHTARSAPLVGYREPVDLAAHYSHEPEFDEDGTEYPPVLPPHGVVMVPSLASLAGIGTTFAGITPFFEYIRDAALSAVLEAYGFPELQFVAEQTSIAAEPLPELPAATAEGWFAYTDNGQAAALEPQMPELAPLQPGFGYQLLADQQPRQFARRGA